MAEDALFAFIPGYPVRRGSRRPSHFHESGFSFEFEAVRTASGPRLASKRLKIEKETTHGLVWWRRRASMA